MKKYIVNVALFLALSAGAQEDSIKTTGYGTTKKAFTVSGYVEPYYSYDFGNPPDHMKPAFLYNHNRHNEFNVNLGLIKGSYSTARVRANLSIGVGTYMNANYAAEAGVLQNIFEANAGYKLSARHNLWFDIGIMPSHIGFEGAIGIDNWTLTRSLAAENSPYFESGAKLSYTTANGKILLSAMALNGWQRITRLDGNSLISFGTQINYKPNDKITLNYSTFFGTDTPDSARLYRTYHNLYSIFRISSVFSFTAGVDIGTEDASPNSNSVNVWYTPVGILRIMPGSKWAVALRGEYYDDQDEVIIKTGTANGFQTLGGSLNIDYLPIKNVAIRLEGRYLRSKDDIFSKDGIANDDNTAITFSTAILF